MNLPVPDSAVSPELALVRVTEIMLQIREQIRPAAPRREAYLRLLKQSSILLPELSRLEGLVESVRLGATQVGSMPPVPPTLRGRIGVGLVAMVRRALFWLTPQLHAFHLKVAAALNEQANATQALVEDLREVHVQIAELKRRVARIAQNLALEEPSESEEPKETNWLQ